MLCLLTRSWGTPILTALYCCINSRNIAYFPSQRVSCSERHRIALGNVACKVVTDLGGIGY